MGVRAGPPARERDSSSGLASAAFRCGGLGVGATAVAWASWALVFWLGADPAMAGAAACALAASGAVVGALPVVAAAVPAAVAPATPAATGAVATAAGRVRDAIARR